LGGTEEASSDGLLAIGTHDEVELGSVAIREVH
jgi:hypothetical protein